MKKALLLLISILIFYSCDIQDNKSIKLTPRFCENQLNLLSSFDTIPTLKTNFKSLNNNLEQTISNYFDKKFCCEYIYFNINHTIDSTDTIKISLRHYYQCDNCPIFSREVNNLSILQNIQGQILFENILVSIDSLDTEIYRFYSRIGKSDIYPNTYREANISLHWDLEVPEIFFCKLIDQLIKGYLKFTNEYSIKKYNKKICQLNHIELKDLAKEIPLKIEIPIVETINTHE